MQLLHAATRRAGFVDSESVRVIDLLLQLINLDVAKYARRRDLIKGGAYMAQALTTLLISVSPYVESIAIAPPFYHFLNAKMLVGPEEVGFPLYQFLYRANAYHQESLFLQHLRSVYVINIAQDYIDDGRTYYALDFTGALALFHHLPSMKSVSVDLLLEYSTGVPVREITNSNITKIAIRHSLVRSIYLAALICSCKALREFEYSIGGRSDMAHGISLFNLKTFIQAILIHRKTLEILDVDVEADLDYRFDDVQSAPSGPTIWEQSGGLRDFLALKHLSLGVYFLMYFARGVNPTHDGSLRLVDCLPENLEYLCVRGYERGENEEHDRQFNELIAVQKTGTSKLKSVVGIDAMIPNAEHVDSNNDPHLLWDRQEEEWSEEE